MFEHKKKRINNVLLVKKKHMQQRFRIKGNISILFTFLASCSGFKELDSQVLYRNHSSMGLSLPLLVLLPEALHSTRAQTLSF